MTRPIIAPVAATLALALGLGACSAGPAEDDLQTPEETATAEEALQTNGDGRTSPLEIPLVVEMYRGTLLAGAIINNGTGYYPNPNNSGSDRRTVVADTTNLAGTDFDNAAESMTVYKGPSYDAWKARNGGREPTVSVYEHPSYGGAVVTLKAGVYKNLDSVGMRKKISSVRFNDGAATPRAEGSVYAVPSIRAVVTLYRDLNRTGMWGTFLVSNPNLNEEPDSDCSLIAIPVPPFATGKCYWTGIGAHFLNDTATSIEVLKGPNYTSSVRVSLCRDPNYAGGCVFFGDANRSVGDLRVSPYNFNDTASSLRIE